MSGESNPFKLTLPDGWEDRTIYTYKGPDDGAVQHYVTLVIDRSVKGVELSEFARDRINAIANTLQGLEVLKDESKMLANGRAVHEFVYRWMPAEDKPIFQKLIYMLIGGVGYTFSGGFSKKTIKTIALEMEQLISSFEPGDIPSEE